MDMGFHRRLRGTRAEAGASAELASLLATLAARQAVSPTAKAIAGHKPASESVTGAQPNSAVFAAETMSDFAKNRPVSFHPAVSAALLTSRQQS